ncbi:MAG: LysE family translocator [Gemmatimonadetes bacterium]|nr:LysE family translocator [Gemmatimonadota bacterium]
MIPIDSLIPFFVASLLICLAPGPDNIFVLTQAAIGGRRAGYSVMLGLCTGLLVHTLAVAVGVAALFAASPFAFTALKLAGGAYLLYLAWGAWRAAASKIPFEQRERIPLRRLYGRGIVMNITNPKVLLFFLAFLPQFAAPERGPLPVQVVTLGGVFIVAVLLVFGTIATVAGSLGEWLAKSDGAQRVLNRIAAVIFVALALMLIVQSK